jgi:hypothetical protein
MHLFVTNKNLQISCTIVKFVALGCQYNIVDKHHIKWVFKI